MSEDKYYDASFKCSENRIWNIEFDIATVRKFCAKHKLQLDEFAYHLLDFDKQLNLIWRGVIRHQDAKRYDGENDFVARSLKGDALEQAMTALQMAILNFTLPCQNEQMRVMSVKKINDLMLGQGLKEKIMGKAKKFLKAQGGQEETT